MKLLKKEKVLKSIKIMIKMIKKQVSLQITIFIFLVGTFIGYYLVDFKTAYGVLNAYLITSKPYVLIIGILFFIPIIINLLLQIFSNNKKKYNEEAYYDIVKLLVHLSFIIFGIFNLAFLWVLMAIGLMIISNDIQISLLIPSIIVFIGFFIIDALVQKYFKIRWYQIFYWIRRKPT